MRLIWSLFLFIIFVLACGFALLNPKDVTVHYYIGQVTWPLAMIVILAFVIGGILGMLVGWRKGRSSGKRKMKAKWDKIEAKRGDS